MNPQYIMSQETQKRQNKLHLLLKELATSGEQIVILCRVIVRTMQWTWILVRKMNSRIFIKRRHPGRNSFFIHITCSTKQIGKTGVYHMILYIHMPNTEYHGPPDPQKTVLYNTFLDCRPTCTFRISMHWEFELTMFPHIFVIVIY